MPAPPVLGAQPRQSGAGNLWRPIPRRKVFSTPFCAHFRGYSAMNSFKHLLLMRCLLMRAIIAGPNVLCFPILRRIG